MGMLPKFEFDEKILSQGSEISRKLDQLRLEKFPPDAKKTLRLFPMSEVAHYLAQSARSCDFGQLKERIANVQSRRS